MDEEVYEENAKEISEEKLQENGTEQKYRYDDDFFEVEQFFDTEKQEPYEERKWEEIEETFRRL